MHSSLIECPSLSKFCVKRLVLHNEWLLDYESGETKRSNYMLGRALCNPRGIPRMDETFGFPQMYYSVFAQDACTTQ